MKFLKKKKKLIFIKRTKKLPAFLVPWKKQQPTRRDKTKALMMGRGNELKSFLRGRRFAAVFYYYHYLWIFIDVYHIVCWFVIVVLWMFHCLLARVFLVVLWEFLKVSVGLLESYIVALEEFYRCFL